VPPDARATVDAETILKRFTRSNFQHLTYQALTELGQAVKTVFLVGIAMKRPYGAKSMKGSRQYDLRALTPLIYAHITPYGRFKLDMNERLPLEAAEHY